MYLGQLGNILLIKDYALVIPLSTILLQYILQIFAEPSGPLGANFWGQAQSSPAKPKFYPILIHFQLQFTCT